jgi:hypothetical protein
MIELMRGDGEAVRCSGQKEREEEEILKISIPLWVPVSSMAITMGLFLFFFLRLCR